MSKPEAGDLKEPKGFPLIPLLLIVFAMWAVWGGIVLLSATVDPPDRIGPLSLPNLAAAGQFGDLFGGINALATALAFAMVWWTGDMQRLDLKLQREELQAQRKEMKDTRVVFERELFESKFFQQIAIFRDIAKGFEFTGAAGVTVSGIHATFSLANAARKILKESNFVAKDSVADFETLLAEAYNKTFAPPLSSMTEPYFKTIYYTISSVDSFEYSSDVEKARYVNIVRGLFSEDELVLIAANAIADPDNGMKARIRHYGLMKHLPLDQRLPLVVKSLGVEAFQGMTGRGLSP